MEIIGHWDLGLDLAFGIGHLTLGFCNWDLIWHLLNPGRFSPGRKIRPLADESAGSQYI